MKKVFLMLVAIVLMFGAAGCGTGNEPKGVSADLAEAEGEIERLEESLRDLESQKNILQSEYDAWKAATQDWVDMKEEEKAAEKEKVKKTTELTVLSQKIADKEKELSEVQAQIDAAKGELIKEYGKPLSFPAGYFYAGKDFPAGRYKIYDGTSNFFVHSKDGEHRVNIILDEKDTDGYVTEFVYTFEDGDEIEASSSFKLIAIE